MLASISPLGERARRQPYAVTVTAYVLASTIAGAALGLLLGAAGSVAVPANRTGAALLALAVGAAAGLVLDRAFPGGRLPGPQRQVDETWLTAFRGWVYGAGFGAQLGVGVATFVTVSAIYVALLGAFLSGSALAGLAVGATFGLARALPVFLTADVHEPGALRVRVRRLHALLPIAHRTVLVAQGAVVGIAIVLAIGATA
jgi:hypothetical protein